MWKFSVLVLWGCSIEVSEPSQARAAVALKTLLRRPLSEEETRKACRLLLASASEEQVRTLAVNVGERWLSQGAAPQDLQHGMTGAVYLALPDREKAEIAETLRSKANWIFHDCKRFFA